jgi:hypothetical protein
MVTREDAERMLIEWVTVTRDRDNRVRAAVAAGLSKYRVHQLTRLGRPTIDRIVAFPGAPASAANVQPGGQHEG